MRLVAARVAGYRRFEAETTVDLTPRVVALVGPNEAGKSSMLDALESLCDPAVDRPWREADFTDRVVPVRDENVIVSGLYELDDEDRTALSDVPGASRIRLWEVGRQADGRAVANVVPNIHRDRTQRDQLASGLKRLADTSSRVLREWLETPAGSLTGDSEDDLEPDAVMEAEPDENTPTDPDTLRDKLVLAIEALENPGEELANPEILSQTAGLLAAHPTRAPAWARGLSPLCTQVSEAYRAPHPNTRAFRILDERCPEFRVLRDSDRQLGSSYRFDEHETPPAPLANLLALAELGWDELRQAASQGSNPTLTTMLKRGNRRLEERMRGSWKQAAVSVELDVSGDGSLNVFPFDVESESHSRIEDRSDGFRSFLALLTFTTNHSAGARRLILGIDEAELHLHYDAQADLVRVLTEQTLANQIVYTTHSAGCLPDDLGSAIRVVRPIPVDRSKIENGFWSASDEPGGLTSLLMAMGASTTAFTPARHALIAEGPSDALLLPAVFRAAKGARPQHALGFQVAGGLAWTPPTQLARLESEASHVAYITDSDQTGSEYCEELEKAGVDPSRIFQLGASGSGLTVEDFIDKATYAAAFTSVLRDVRGFQGVDLVARDLPDRGAVDAAEAFARSHGVEPPSKPRVAEHILRATRASLAYSFWDPGSETPAPLLRRTRKRQIETLLSDVYVALRLDPRSIEG